LGAPVVPDVNRMSDGADGGGRHIGRGAQELVPLRAPDRNRPCEIGQIRLVRPEHSDVVGAEEVRSRDHQPGVTAAEDVRGLAAFESGVHGDEDGAGLPDAQRGNYPLDAVEQPDTSAVARSDPRRPECGTEPAGLGEQLGVRK
jgi:hypothetical protein